MTMIIDRKSAAMLAILATALASCTPNDIGLGTAVRNNNVAQIVEPDPKYEDEMVADGNQTAAAQERYRKGTVKKAVGVKTTSSNSSN